MAISNQYIADFLVNYWDNYGSLSGLSTNANSIYQLIFSRRRLEKSDKPVNDYIYGVLGITPKGDLGEELTFEIQNHIMAYKSLVNIKDMKRYPKLQRMSAKLKTTPEDMIAGAGFYNYLNAEPELYSQKELNLLYYISANLFLFVANNK